VQRKIAKQNDDETESTTTTDSLQKALLVAQADLNYTVYFPTDRKYIGLFPVGNTPSWITRETEIYKDILERTRTVELKGPDGEDGENEPQNGPAKGIDMNIDGKKVEKDGKTPRKRSAPRVDTTAERNGSKKRKVMEHDVATESDASTSESESQDEDDSSEDEGVALHQPLPANSREGGQRDIRVKGQERQPPKQSKKGRQKAESPSPAIESGEISDGGFFE